MIASRYKLVRRIGVGERSQVFEAEDLVIRDRVALKTVKEELRHDHVSELRDELAAIYSGSSKFLVEIVDSGVGFDYSIIVMEMAKGISLARYLELWGSVDLALAIRVGLNLCHLLLRLREAGFEVSRVKPTDIFIKRRRPPRLPHMTVVGFDARRIAADETLTWSVEVKAVASLVRTIAFSGVSPGTGDPSVSLALRRVLDTAEGREPGLHYPTIRGLLHGLVRAGQASG